MMKKYCDFCDKEFEEGTTEKIHTMKVTERYEVDQVPAEITAEKGEAPKEAQSVPGKVQMQSTYDLDACDECFKERFIEFSHKQKELELKKKAENK